MDKQFASSPEYFKKKYEEGALFVLEKYLGHMPWDWVDCITFMATQGMDKNNGAYLIIMDDPESSRLFDLLSRDQIEVFVVTDRKKDGMTVLWNCLVTPEKVDGHDDAKPLFMGGDNLRDFCDRENIFYKTAINSKGKLLSGTNLQWQKKEGEDCRLPLNKNDTSGDSQ